MEIIDCMDRVCVLGAGSSGLTAAKHLKEQGFAVDVLEREDDLGGNWNYCKPNARVYRSTRMISSKRFTQYPDFKFPKHYPDYPHHAQVLQYLRDYARHFKIEPLIEYRNGVERIEPADDGRAWDVTCANGQARRYGALFICNGHNWSPKYPQYPGEFSGTVMHSANYRTPDVLAGQRVLVVGGGNSGCDIACEAAQHARSIFHSTRRGYHYIPKYLFGKPADRLTDNLLQLGLPLKIRRAIFERVLRLVVGSPEKYGLPRPDHRLFETHPIINSLLLYYVQHGAIHPKPDIARLDGQTVHFTDGSSEEIDLIVYSTGYNIVFPFIDSAHLNWRDGRPDLYLNVFHPSHDNLFVIGLIQPDSGQFGLVHWQSAAAAMYLRGVRDGRPSVEALRTRKATPHAELSGGTAYAQTTRHYLEIEHWSYRKTLQRLVDELSRGAGAAKRVAPAV